MNWHTTFRIGNCVIFISSEHDACTTELKKVVALYQTTELAPEIFFFIRSGHGKIELWADQELLWKCDNPGEICAGFEVHLYARAMKGLVPEFASIHAASIAINHSVTMFAGVSGAGKSSWCTKAMLEGAYYLSDEFSLLMESGEIAPFPRPLQWGQEEHPAFPKDEMRKSPLLTEEVFSFPDVEGNTVNNCLWIPKRVQLQPLPLSHIIFPRYDCDAQACEIIPVRRGEMLMEMLQHLHYKERPDISLKKLNQRIPESCDAYRVRFSDVHQAWDILNSRLV